jgi:type IV secretory pathway TraG/TraD family ATPase VirD4
VLVDPFNITGTAAHGLNWLDTLNPDDPDVVSRAAGLADMLVVTEGADSESHWNDTARELLRGLLIYVAGLPGDRRSMPELRRIVTASEGRSGRHPGRHARRPETRPAHSSARGDGAQEWPRARRISAVSLVCGAPVADFPRQHAQTPQTRPARPV